MIISHGRRYVFIHIPKTGGTSLAAALEARAMADDILVGDTPKALRRRRRLDTLPTPIRLTKHSRLRDAHGALTEDQMRSYFVVTLVRNPWDRTLSYYHWLREQRFEHPAVRRARALDFSGFLNDPDIQASLGAETASHYVTTPGGVETCDAFVRLEHLSRDITSFEAHLGFAVTPLQHLNRSSGRCVNYRAAYEDAEAEIVERLCAKDIARFGYRFDSPE